MRHIWEDDIQFKGGRDQHHIRRISSKDIDEYIWKCRKVLAKRFDLCKTFHQARLDDNHYLSQQMTLNFIKKTADACYEREREKIYQEVIYPTRELMERYRPVKL